MMDRVKNVFKSITIEPVIFIFIWGNLILDGAEIQTNLMLYRACVNELGYNKTLCENLSDEDDIKTAAAVSP